MEMINDLAGRAAELAHTLKLEKIYERSLELLEASPVPRLTAHFDLVLFAFVYFILLDLFVYYILAPQLCQVDSQTAKKGKEALSVDELNKNGGSLRLKWAHMIPSFVHALVVGIGSIYFCLADPQGLSLSRQTRLLGYSPDIGNMVAFSVGYFLWDTMICVLNPTVYGPSFLVHAIMALVGLVGSFVQHLGTGHCLIFYVNRYLMFEVSTIFVDFHWFFAKTGYDKTTRQFIADVLGLISYLVIRIVFGYWTSYMLMRDFYEWYQTGSYVLAPIIIGTGLQFLSHVLNMYWFIKLVKSALKPAPKQKTQ